MYSWVSPECCGPPGASGHSPSILASTSRCSCPLCTHGVRLAVFVYFLRLTWGSLSIPLTMLTVLGVLDVPSLLVVVLGHLLVSDATLGHPSCTSCPCRGCLPLLHHGVSFLRLPIGSPLCGVHPGGVWCGVAPLRPPGCCSLLGIAGAIRSLLDPFHL